MTIELSLEEQASNTCNSDDHLAEIIAGLTEQEAKRLWSVLVYMKPHLAD
jgi:hypothetical protein